MFAMTASGLESHSVLWPSVNLITKRQGENRAVFKKHGEEVQAAAAAGVPLFSESALARQADPHLMKGRPWGDF